MHEGDTAQQASRMTLGRYQLLQVIVQGGMGDVWLAEDPRLKRRVAIKTLPPHSQRDSEYALRFEREARAAAALNHPHILPVHDYGQQALPNGQLITYIVMPYVAGGTLGDRIAHLAQQQALMPVSEAFIYLTQAAEAIDYAHQHHVLHRDIKPNNMLLRDASWLLLADFGIARILSDREESLTQTGRGFGTPKYMAPEQAQGRAEDASDNYSLAVIAYQLLTGRLPFVADTDYATMIQHMLTPPPPPRQVNPTLSLRVEQVLLQGLAKDPAQRPPSARALVTDLQQALAGPALDTTLIRHPLSPMGITASTDYDARYGQQTAPAPPPFPDNGKLTSPGTHTGITRRQALVGGTALVVAAGGLGAWAISSALHASPQPQTAHLKSHPKLALDRNAPIALLGHNRPISALAWSPLSNILASAARDNQVMLWNSSGQMTQPAAKSLLDAGIDTSLRLAWSPKADMLAIGNAGMDTKTLDTKIYVYTSDLSGFASGYTNQFTVVGTISVHALCWAPGPYLIAGYEGFSKDYKKSYLVLELWDPAEPQQGLPFLQQEGLANALLLSPDGSMLAIGGANSAIIGRPTKAGQKAHWQQLAILRDQYKSSADSIAWSPDGRYLAAISQFNNRITIWDWQHDPRPYQLLPQVDTTPQLMSIAWSPARAHPWLAAKDLDSTVYVWENVNPRAGASESVAPIRTLAGIKSDQKYADDYPLAWSADGQWLAAGYYDTNDTIFVWKV
ncbi:MAG: serine/threonine-protein kinase [Ktedonobacteraceae bacterium]|nr:serine/threonine-protein kinase [Chloroflexota bacterium]